MSQKTAKVVTCVFTNEWKNPSGSMVYYHEITLDNLETGTVGKMEKYPTEISQGATITYTLDTATKKIKVISSNMDTKTKSEAKETSKAPFTGAKTSYAKNPSDFLGFTWGYAKDLIIAGKTMADVEELNKVARYIYAEIGKMLKNE